MALPVSAKRRVSAAFSAEDDPNDPSQRLMNLALDAIVRARTVKLSELLRASWGGF